MPIFWADLVQFVQDTDTRWAADLRVHLSASCSMQGRWAVSRLQSWTALWRLGTNLRICIHDHPLYLTHELCEFAFRRHTVCRCDETEKVLP